MGGVFFNTTISGEGLRVTSGVGNPRLSGALMTDRWDIPVPVYRAITRIGVLEPETNPGVPEPEPVLPQEFPGSPEHPLC